MKQQNDDSACNRKRPINNAEYSLSLDFIQRNT